MQDRQIHFSFVGGLAIAAGLIALGLVAATFIFDSIAIGFLSLHFAIGSALFRVRSWLCVLSGRERDAFEMGRESAHLTPVRSRT